MIVTLGAPSCLYTSAERGTQSDNNKIYKIYEDVNVADRLDFLHILKMLKKNRFPFDSYRRR